MGVGCRVCERGEVMKNKFIKVTCITNGINAIVIGVMLGLLLVFGQRVSKLEQAVKTYEERQQALISQDKANREELADFKRYIQSGEASGG